MKKKVVATLNLIKERRKRGVCTQCGHGSGDWREVGPDGKFVRSTRLCATCSRLNDEARARAVAAYEREHPTASLSLWCASFTVYGDDYEPEDLPGPANNNGSRFVCSS
jgi:hypothetical protein